jgi:hypothetical protein
VAILFPAAIVEFPHKADYVLLAFILTATGQGWLVEMRSPIYRLQGSSGFLLPPRVPSDGEGSKDGVREVQWAWHSTYCYKGQRVWQQPLSTRLDILSVEPARTPCVPDRVSGRDFCISVKASYPVTRRL